MEGVEGLQRRVMELEQQVRSLELEKRKLIEKIERNAKLALDSVKEAHMYIGYIKKDIETWK